MKKTVLAVFLAATAMFIWGFIFWAVSALPFNAIQQSSNDMAVGETLRQLFPHSGTYMIPDKRNGASNDREYWQSLAEAGPVATVHINNEGVTETETGYSMLKGYIHLLISVSLMTVILMKCLSSLPNYRSRLMFVVSVGFLGTFFCNTEWIIWFYHPAGLYLYEIFYHTIAWLLAGFILAAFITPQQQDLKP